jgi:glucose/arabinose dehydrogenase
MRRWWRVGSAFVLLLALCGALAAAISPRSVALGAGTLALPPGFIDETIVGGLLAPRAFAFAPDGRILIAETGSDTSQDINFASIRIFKNGALLSKRAITFDVCGDGERGLLGIELDPGFATNGYVYVYYTRQAASGPACAYNAGASGPRNRVSRVTMTGDLAGDERILLDNIPSDSGIHNSGDLHFGADGYLYISTGNGGSDSNISQDTTSLGGKILRIGPTAAGGYAIPSDNPFANNGSARRCGDTPPPAGSGPCKEIFANGFRNPFRFTIQPGTGVPFVGDVGGGSWEEIDQVTGGGNYGYPIREGHCPAGVNCPPNEPPDPSYTNPIYDYSHTGNSSNDAAVIAGPFYTGGGYPAEYLNSLFFADYVRGWIKRLVYNNGSNTWSALDFGSGGEAIIGLRIGLDTNLYYLEIASTADSKIHRIRYQSGANLPPSAQISASPVSGPTPLAVTFSAAGSSDPENEGLIYHWNFGDGAVADTAVPTVTHTYNNAVNNTATLTVTDTGNPPATSAPATITIYAGDESPVGTIVLTNTTDLSRQDRYYAGDTWQFGVTGLYDKETPAQNLVVSWNIQLHHREHFHPFSSAQGLTGQMTIPTTGETDPLVSYRLTLGITDGRGQTATFVRELLPVTKTLTLATDPPGGTLLLEHQAFATPLSVARVVGMNIPIEAPSPQQIGGKPYRFVRWSNNGPRAQTLAMPPAGGTYTATYVPGYATWLPAVRR